MATSAPPGKRVFPPFPEPPAGVKLVPFAQFDEKAWGIRAYNVDDSIEVDAQGVETVALGSSHSIDRCKSNRKEKKHYQAPQPDDTPVTQNTNKTRVDWWDQWSTDAHTKFVDVDPKLTLEEKLARASEQFHSWRKLGTNTDVHSVSYIWDKFRFYAGFLSYAKGGESTKMSEPAYDEDEGDAIIDEMVPEAPANEKLELFAKSIESSIKVFLSEWLQDNGQHVWAGNLKTYPWVVFFFLDFIKRSRIVEGKEEEDLIRALASVEQAKKELPLTHALAQVAPDDWSAALVALWGSKIPPFTWGQDGNDVKDRMSEIWESGARRMAEQNGATTEAQETASADTTAPATDQTAPGDHAEPTQGNSWEAENGWGDSGGGWDNGGWGEGEGDANEAQDTLDHSGWVVDTPSIMRWLGPTALPNTHTTGIVEHSVRKVKEVIPAGQNIIIDDGYGAAAVEQQLQNRFARVVLAPWLVGREVRPPGDSLMAPEIKSTSVGPVVGEGSMDVDATFAHDPSKDDIFLLIEPQHTSLFQNAIGMGILSIWIQIARVDDVEAGRVRTAAGRFYAYAEQLTSFYPTFYLTRAQTGGVMEI